MAMVACRQGTSPLPGTQIAGAPLETRRCWSEQVTDLSLVDGVSSYEAATLMAAGCIRQWGRNAKAHDCGHCRRVDVGRCRSTRWGASVLSKRVGERADARWIQHQSRWLPGLPVATPGLSATVPGHITSRIRKRSSCSARRSR